MSRVAASKPPPVTMARSLRPSPSKSPVASDESKLRMSWFWAGASKLVGGLGSAGGGARTDVDVVVDGPGAWPQRTTSPSRSFPMTRSTRPSPFTSPTAVRLGRPRLVYGIRYPRSGSRLWSGAWAWIPMAPTPAWTTTRSVRSSPFMSPATTPSG